MLLLLLLFLLFTTNLVRKLVHQALWKVSIKDSTPEKELSVSFVKGVGM